MSFDYVCPSQTYFVPEYLITGCDDWPGFSVLCLEGRAAAGREGRAGNHEKRAAPPESPGEPLGAHDALRESFHFITDSLLLGVGSHPFYIFGTEN